MRRSALMRSFYLFVIILLLAGNAGMAQSGWVTQNSGANSWLQTVSFTDANTGTAVGVFGQIRRTTDGGNTWTLLAGGANKYLTGVSFTDSNNGTIVGDLGHILRTTDGGATWTTQASGTTNFLWQVKFTDASTGTVVGNGGTILRTTNGGTTWVSQTSGTSNDLYYVDFTDANNGTVVGVNGTILRTTNGGATWTSQASGTIKNLLGVSFSDANNGTIAGMDGIILRTTNGGTTWTPQTSGTLNKLMGVSFPDANNGTIVGELGTILRTTNGGATWTTQTSGTIRDLVGVDFINANVGTIVGENGVILRTSSGGATCTSAPQQPGAIAGAASACSGTVQTYSIAGVPGANSYTWTLPAGWSGFSTNSSITVTTGATPGNISVSAVNPCGTGVARSFAVAPNASPAATNTAGGPTTFCQGGSVTLNANTGTGLTYQWQLNGNNISGATNASFMANASGSYTVVVNGSNSCSAISNATGVTVNPLPVPVITISGNTLSAPAGFNAYAWYRNSALIPGATASAYTPTQSGNYYAIVRNGNNCPGQSNAINITSLGVADHFSEDQFILYPNPANGAVKLKGLPQTNDKTISIKVLDVSGKIILTDEIKVNPEGNDKELDIAGLPAGLYFIKICSDKVNLVKQIIKK